MKNYSHSKISYTAILCARSLAENTNIPYAKEIWQEAEKEGFSEKEFMFKITDFLSKFFKGIGLIHSFLEGRYLATNQTLKKLGYPYTIEIASGLTPRGLEFSDKKFNYIETDLPKMVSIKRKIISNLNKKINLLPLDVLDRKEFLKIGKKYKDSKNKRRLAIIHSGLWTYLTGEEQITLAKNIRGVLKRYSPKGYWLSLDFRPKSLQKNMFFRLFRRGITKRTERKPTRFKDKKELIEFMNQQGFDIKIIQNKNITHSLNTIKKFKLKESDVLRQSGNFEVYVMTLK